MNLPPCEKLPVTPLQKLEHPLFDRRNLQVWVKRDDLNSPPGFSSLQGNKRHKLHDNLLKMLQQKKKGIITFGGAHSNHIAAVADAGAYYGFKTVGIIRGEELENQPERWSHTLSQAHQQGMHFHFVCRKAYRQRNELAYQRLWQNRYPNLWLVPEGGSNPFGVLGMETVIQQLQQQRPDWTHLFSAVGSGGTLAGLIQATSKLEDAHQKNLIGIATLKEEQALLNSMNEWISCPETVNWSLQPSPYHTRYGQTCSELQKVQQWFEHQFNIPLDPIYTVKMVAGFLRVLPNLPSGSQIILYHSGGLQGRF